MYTSRPAGAPSKQSSPASSNAMSSSMVSEHQTSTPQGQQADRRTARRGSAGVPETSLACTPAVRSLLSGSSLQALVVSLLLTLWALLHTVVQGICLYVYLEEQ